MRYFIITFGCQMNKSDSERIASVLEKEGYSPASIIDETDLIVVNMCSVRQSAVDRVYGLIPKFEKLKTLPAGRQVKTILTGCITKSDKWKLEKKFDQVLKFKDLLKYQPKCQDKSVAYVPISSGCNNFCTYCVVPYTRGLLACRDHNQILKEVKDAIEKGAKKIWLLGQNVNDYQSPTDGSVGSPKLLKMANNIPGDFSIRFMSPNPKNFSDELIDVMAKSKKIAKYLNLPVQSGDDKILKKMNRPYTVKQYKDLVKKIRKKMPEINLSTDVIVGFPGETKKQFENTVKLFNEMKFNIAYISKYSPRPGTVAQKMKDNVPIKEKQRRWRILNGLVNKK